MLGVPVASPTRPFEDGLVPGGRGPFTVVPAPAASDGTQLDANSSRSALNVSANLGTMARPCGAPGYTL